jgi:hypothetical protein
MFPLNTILAWSINIIMNKKYDNNNIIIASRAYFVQVDYSLSMTLSTSQERAGDRSMLRPQRSRQLCWHAKLPRNTRIPIVLS